VDCQANFAGDVRRTACASPAAHVRFEAWGSNWTKKNASSTLPLSVGTHDRNISNDMRLLIFASQDAMRELDDAKDQGFSKGEAGRRRAVEESGFSGKTIVGTDLATLRLPPQ
jgi:hypothetical protein